VITGKGIWAGFNRLSRRTRVMWGIYMLTVGLLGHFFMNDIERFLNPRKQIDEPKRSL